MADLSDPEVAQDGRVAAGLEVRQTQFGFLVLQTAFHGPTAEGHMPEHGPRDSGRGVAEEELLLVAIQHVASHDQPVRTDHARAARQPAGNGFRFPDHRTFVGVPFWGCPDSSMTPIACSSA